MSVSLGEIVADLGGELLNGPPDLLIKRIAPLDTADQDSISFLSNPKYTRQMAATQAACVIVGEEQRNAALNRGCSIVVDQPYLYFAKLTQWWRKRHAEVGVQGIHSTAVVHPEALVHPSATIGPLCVVERGAVIGAETVLKSRVTVSEFCKIGDRCLLHPGVVIGADGFGFAKIEAFGSRSSN